MHCWLRFVLFLTLRVWRLSAGRSQWVFSCRLHHVVCVGLLISRSPAGDVNAISHTTVRGGGIISQALEMVPYTSPFSGFVLCGSCGLHQKFEKCRIMNKGKELYKCSTCNSKETLLRKHLGKWPMPEFTALSEEVKTEFMRSVTGSANLVEGFQKLTEKEKLASFEEHAETYHERGRFLPLSAWAKEGYDIEAIRTLTKPCDIRVHPVLGDTYRVHIFESGNEGSKGVKRSSEIEGGSDRAKSAKMLALCDKDSDSTSSSSSSGSHRKRKSKKDKKRKHKKDKKHKRTSHREETAAERKAREAHEKVMAKEKAKQVEANKRFAQKVLVKLAPVVASMDATMAKDGFELVPGVIRKPFDEMAVQLKSQNDLAKRVADDGESDSEMPDDLEAPTCSLGYSQSSFRHDL
jgi:hypothetical protein